MDIGARFGDQRRTELTDALCILHLLVGNAVGNADKLIENVLGIVKIRRFDLADTLLHRPLEVDRGGAGSNDPGRLAV